MKSKYLTKRKEAENPCIASLRRRGLATGPTPRTLRLVVIVHWWLGPGRCSVEIYAVAFL